MQRTNIFLTDEQQRRLDRRAKEQGVSKSELIRTILDEALAITRASAEPERAIMASSGIWSDRNQANVDGVLRWRQEAPMRGLKSEAL